MVRAGVAREFHAPVVAGADRRSFVTIEVHKLGGTSVGSAEAIARCAHNVIAACSESRLVVVTSAMSGVTSHLVALADALDAAGVSTLRERHRETLEALGAIEEAPALRALLDEVAAVLSAAAMLGELSLRGRDRVLATGEKLAARLVAAALRAQGHDAVALDADTFLPTDGRFGEATPEGRLAARAIRAHLQPHLDASRIPVVTGYCGHAPDGATATLGRGGTDLSATVLGAALQAERVVIWTDVDGVFTADPRAVPTARCIGRLHYREAAEMSFYGAKVLHQRTMIPVASARIPVITRNTFAPEHPGTRIDATFSPGSHPVKAITAVRQQALLSVEGNGMAGVPGVAAAVFGALASADISVTMISQASSEASICLAVPAARAPDAERALKVALARPMALGHIEEIVVQGDVGLLAAVGLGMADTPGVAATALTALARVGVSVRAVAQGSSELNLTLAVDGADLPAALRAVHAAFRLDRRDPDPSTPEQPGAASLDLILIGCGKVARAVLAQVGADRGGAFARLGVQPRVVGLADRSGFVLAPAGLTPDALAELLQAKLQGQPLADAAGGRPGSASDLVREALTWRLSRPVVVDLSEGEAVAEAYAVALEHGADVVTANKGPLAGPRFEAIHRSAAAHHRQLRAEATVGAGLPIVDTLQMLRDTGDRIRAIEGSLSGTLGYLLGRVAEGVALSVAVGEARQLGYTEPDPLEDLGGADVARKAVILARWAGLPAEPESRATSAAGLPVSLQPLARFDEAPADLEAALRAQVDEALAARVSAAAEAGQALRFVARLTERGIAVGPTEVPAGSSLGLLSGTDNLVLFRTDRYHDRPLVIVGPGAGVEVTAMGVVGDLQRIAAGR